MKTHVDFGKKTYVQLTNTCTIGELLPIFTNENSNVHNTYQSSSGVRGSQNDYVSFGPAKFQP